MRALKPKPEGYVEHNGRSERPRRDGDRGDRRPRRDGERPRRDGDRGDRRPRRDNNHHNENNND